ncbi:MAG: hypothetical protein WDN49_22080 [Acetobacteraceae bacterium]
MGGRFGHPAAARHRFGSPRLRDRRDRGGEGIRGAAGLRAGRGGPATGPAFTVIGGTADDARLLAAGPVFVTGQYAEDELPDLLRAHAPDVAFIPSIWPETWCFTLGHAWRAGLRAAVFDIGAPAERVKRTGWGWVLPLGLPATAVNDALLGVGRVQPIRRLAKRESPSQFPPNPVI